MATKIINTNGDNTPNYNTVRISAIDLPVAPPIPPTDNGEGPTVPLQRIQIKPQEEDDGKTRLIRGNSTPTTPTTVPIGRNHPLPPEQWVHGWLVAITGPMKGNSFPVILGNNTVGRANTNTICLPSDKGISRSQFSIRYQQGKNSYLVAPINSASQVTYLADGDELIFPTPICEGDTLRLSSETTMRFVPFCDSQFRWTYDQNPAAPAPAPTPAPAPKPGMPNISKDRKGPQITPIHFPTQEIGIDKSSRDLPTVRITPAAPGTDLDATVRIERASRPSAEQQTEDDGHTRIFRRIPQDNQASGSNRHPAESWEQGWLVAISGPMKGMYFPITIGINQGGRSDTCRICLSADNGISGEQFAIRYVKSRKQFLVTNIDTASQLTYLNNDELTGYEPIKRGDILRVSEQTSLRFIPFCNDSFYWDYPETL